MVFIETVPSNWRVLRDRADTVHHGIVERHEYTRICNGKRSQQVLWMARPGQSGWKGQGRTPFKTRKEAGEFVLAQSAIPYSEKRTPNRKVKRR